MYQQSVRVLETLHAAGWVKGTSEGRVLKLGIYSRVGGRQAPVKGSAVMTAAGSVRSKVAIKSPAVRIDPSGRRHLSVPSAGASSGMNIFITCPPIGTEHESPFELSDQFGPISVVYINLVHFPLQGPVIAPTSSSPGPRSRTELESPFELSK